MTYKVMLQLLELVHGQFLALWPPLLPYGYSYKASVPDRVKPSFVIFDIRALWRSRAHDWASECPDVKNYKWRLNPVWHWTLYRCNHMAAVIVKGLINREVITVIESHVSTTLLFSLLSFELKVTQGHTWSVICSWLSSADCWRWWSFSSDWTSSLTVTAILSVDDEFVNDQNLLGCSLSKSSPASSSCH